MNATTIHPLTPREALSAISLPSELHVATVDAREWTMAPAGVHPLTRRDLLAEGLDGTMWFGSSPVTGRADADQELFYRTPVGAFLSHRELAQMRRAGRAGESLGA
jgi:hypothetical protein